MNKPMMHLLSLFLSLCAAGCASVSVNYIVPMANIQITPPVIEKQIPLKVAVVLPPEDSVYTKEEASGDTVTVQSGKLLRKFSTEVLPQLFSGTDFISGKPYPSDVSAIVIPTMEDFSYEAISVALGFGLKFDATVALKIAITDPEGMQIWSRVGKAKKTSRDVVSPIIPTWELIGEATSMATLEAFKDMAKEISIAREVTAYDVKKAATIVAAARTSRAAEAQLATAQTAQAQGDYIKALIAMRQALQDDPKGPNTLTAALQLLQTLCDPETAKHLREEAQMLDSPVAGNPGAPAPIAVSARAPYAPACEAQQQNREGVALAREGKRAEALAKFQAARQAAPGLVPKASYNAALLLVQTGKLQEAVQAYLEAHRGFLAAADQQEALQRLVAVAQRTSLATPASADRRYRLGIVRAQQKRYPEAITEFEAALQDAPWLVDAYYNLGLVYDFVSRPANALRVLRIYVQLAPTSPNLGPVKTKIVELEDKMGLSSPVGK